MNRFSHGIMLCLLLTACAPAPVYQAHAQTQRYTPPAASAGPVKHKLHQHFKEWKGVRYREGGMSKSGIDCSGFVHLAYKKLNKPIARSTELLSQSGRSVSSAQLRAGDLVFFKTGWKKRHVGIYMGQGKFMHASSSRGVMMSKLSNPYWKDAYWMARRYY